MSKEIMQARERNKEEIRNFLPNGFKLVTRAASGRNKALLLRDGAVEQEAPGFFSVELAAKWLREFAQERPAVPTRTALGWSCNAGEWSADVSRSQPGALLPDATAMLRVEADNSGEQTVYWWSVDCLDQSRNFRSGNGAAYDLTRAMLAAEESAHAALGLPYQYPIG